MFKLYDLNLREIPFPDGVMPLDIFVGSISKTRETETIPGRNGVMNYGFNYDSRPVRITLLAEGNDRIDYRLIRNAVFELFDLHDVFYIEETDVPSRVLKVTIDESYQPDRLTRDDASFDINLRTLDSVFWESKYTTLELHDSGYSATAEKYGLVDNIDDEKVKYRFENGQETVELTSNLFEPGNIHNSSGINLDSVADYARSKLHHEVFQGVQYTIDLNDSSGNVNYIRLHYFREDGSYVGNDSRMPVVDSNGKSTYTFAAQSERLRLVFYPKTNKQINTGDIGNSIQVKLTKPSSKIGFTVYNAGNVTVEPESMSLNIYIKNLITGGNFTIRNKTTGDTFIMERSSDNFELRIKGMVVGLGGISNIFRNTNRRFIKLVPGDNQFEILNGTFEEIGFEFKYLYK